MPPDNEEMAREIDRLNRALFGDRDNPEDLGIKAELLHIKQTLGELTLLAKWSIGLVLTAVLTALMSLVIRAHL